MGSYADAKNNREQTVRRDATERSNQASPEGSLHVAYNEAHNDEGTCELPSRARCLGFLPETSSNFVSQRILCP